MALVARERSFRDPDGFVFRAGSRILRAVEPSAFDSLQEFLGSQVAKSFTSAGRLVTTSFPGRAEFASDIPADYHLAEHELIPFASIPAEWPPEMLAAAGFLTLDLAEQCLEQGWRLKDASPYNVLFRGPTAVFVDLLSFEKRDPTDSLWPPYAQFVRTFLLPLLAYRASNESLVRVWLASRDGLLPGQVYRALSWTQRLTSPGLSLASVPTWLTKQAESDESIYKPRPTDPDRATFTLSTVFRRLRRQLRRLSSGQGDSHWSRYLDTLTHYNKEQFAFKEAFVAEALREFAPQQVLDVGANTGHFSELAANSGARVVAIDYDQAAAGRIWQRAFEKKLDILPLVVDLSRPTPALGWRNREYRSFLDRARGAFDLVLMLAVIHHLLVTERVPLDEILELAAELTTDLLLIEFVEPSDPMFRRLARGRDPLYAHLTASYFESACGSRFRIVRREPIPQSNRILYLLRRKH